MNRKIFLLTLCFLIALIPMLFGAGNNRATIDTKDSAITYDPNARVNLKPSSEPAHINTGRGFGDILMTIDLAAIGVPAVGYAGAGITWDGTYLYYVNQNDQKIYVIDPTGPSVVTSWSTGLSGPWGCGSEINIWITDYTTSMIHEYDWGGTPTGNSFYCGMGGASWMGDASEWWADGEIWILAVGGTNRAYKFSVPGGTYLADIGDPAWTYTSQRGFTYDPHNDKFFVGGWNSDMVWEINSDGTPTGRQFYFNAIAGLAYDWQSTLHPTPVLWLTTSASYNYIYMVDADNPQPVFEIVWDFEDGWQGWTHTNGLSFPGGWEPYDATYRSGWGYQCPSSDDSSMCIDSDLYFGATMDTALSPFLVPLPGIEWLDYGFFYNDLATHFDYFEVGIKYFDGSTWTVDTLRMYDSDYLGNWESIDVSAYSTCDLFQLYFYYHAPGWYYYAAFDNVSIVAELAEHDVGCNQVASPPAGGMVLAGDYDVIGNIKNFGDFIETFDATATVYDTLAGWTVIFKTTLTITNFSPAAESLVNFGMVTLEDDKVFYTEIYTELSDANPGNDTSSIFTSTIRPDFLWDFETGWQGWTHTNGMTFPCGWDVQVAMLHSNANSPDPGDSSMWVDSDACGYTYTIWDTCYSPVIIPTVDMEWLKWGCGYQNFAGIDWFTVGIKTFSGGAWNPPVELRFYNTDIGPNIWDSVDVSAYQADDSLRIFFSYNDGDYTWFASFDNVMINGLAPGVAEKPGETMPLVFGLLKISPNPVKDDATVSYTTTRKGPVSLKVYDCAGRLVRTLIDRNEIAGHKTVYWDGKDANHRSVAAGVYFYRLVAEEKTATKKMVVVR